MGIDDEQVLIAGAGPVGLVAAAYLVRQGVPVTVIESGANLSAESRASTFHPPTLDMLDKIDAAKRRCAPHTKLLDGGETVVALALTANPRSQRQRASESANAATGHENGHRLRGVVLDP